MQSYGCAGRSSYPGPGTAVPYLEGRPFRAPATDYPILRTLEYASAWLVLSDASPYADIPQLQALIASYSCILLNLGSTVSAPSSTAPQVI